jgi:hypothetical protein
VGVGCGAPWGLEVGEWEWEWNPSALPSTHRVHSPGMGPAIKPICQPPAASENIDSWMPSSDLTSQVFLIGPWTWRCWSNCRSRRCGWSFSRPSERCPFTQANTCQALTREFEETVLLPACRETGVSILRTRCKTTFQVENRYESARVSLHPSMSDVPHVAMRDDLRLTSPFKLDVNDGILSILSFQP